MEKKKHKITIDPKNGEVTEQLQQIVKQNNAQQGTNRKQRRAIEKKNKQQEKRLRRYLELHPEAIKITLDEEAVKKVEEQERIEKEKNNEISMIEAMRESNVKLDNTTEIIDVPFTELAEEEK